MLRIPKISMINAQSLFNISQKTIIQKNNETKSKIFVVLDDEGNNMHNLNDRVTICPINELNNKVKQDIILTGDNNQLQKKCNLIFFDWKKVC